MPSATSSPTTPKTKKKRKRVAGRMPSKTTAAYWEQAVIRLTKDQWESSNFFVRIKLHNQRRRIRLEATTREEAGREALAEYLKILASGWPVDDTTKPVFVTNQDLSADPTVGEWIGMAKVKAVVRARSIDKYAESLRTIVGEIMGMHRARKAEQRTLIDNYKVFDLTKETLNSWLDGRMAKARVLDAVRERQAKNTIRSLVTNAKGLFSEQILDAVGLSVEKQAPLPFRGLKLPPKSQTRYTSRFDAKALLKTAASELGNPGPEVDQEARLARFEQWKILYLALVAGLRYSEIDLLRIRDVSLDEGRIAIRTHETFNPKSDSSEAEVLVSNNAAATLREMIKHTKGEWFIKDGASSRNRHYRAGSHHDKLITWLRSYEERGFRPFADIRKPIHELRKEAGTLVNSQHGLYETKNFLRHSSIATTAAYYVSTKGNITTGLS